MLLLKKASQSSKSAVFSLAWIPRAICARGMSYRLTSKTLCFSFAHLLSYVFKRQAPVAHLFFGFFFFNLTQCWACGRLRNFTGPKASYCHILCGFQYTPQRWSLPPHTHLFLPCKKIDSMSKGKAHLATQPLWPILSCTMEKLCRHMI